MIYDAVLPAVASGTEDGVPFVSVEGIRDFDLRAVMECGQCFRFSPVAGSRHECEYSGVAHGRFIAAATDGDTRWVRPPLPCRPSKLRFDVDALRSPGAS